MSITNELREYADTLSERVRCGATIPSPLNPHSGAPIGPTRETEELYAIADRIDAEHEKAIRELNNFADSVADSCVLLPKDADGEPIRFKDKVTVPWSEKVYEVGGFSYQENIHTGRMTIWIDVYEDGKYKALCAADSCRHYHAPTVEDVLREFGDKYCDMYEGSDDESKLFAEYAAKLQLRGDK